MMKMQRQIGGHMFELLTFCNNAYNKALDFSMQSWIDNAEADNIVVYTDNEDTGKLWQMLNITDFRLGLKENLDWHMCCAFKPLVLQQYLSTAKEGTKFFLMDADCYIIKSCLPAIEGDDWWIRTFRNDKTIEDASPKKSISLFFGVVCDEMREFCNKWIYLTKLVEKLFPDKIKEYRKRALHTHEQAVYQFMLTESEGVQNLNENIWGNERDKLHEWIEMVEKYKDEVRVLHFKSGRWKDDDIIERILGIIYENPMCKSME